MTFSASRAEFWTYIAPGSTEVLDQPGAHDFCAYIAAWCYSGQDTPEHLRGTAAFLGLLPGMTFPASRARFWTYIASGSTEVPGPGAHDLCICIVAWSYTGQDTPEYLRGTAAFLDLLPS
ncbi:unnamed protein product [Gongylonema pulchrum]|uniref:Rab-GAP TBC domain-containing protein n=1 Tax=Gongylonema pulchrum TaxID=637853 RepID=A0A183EKC9_9BILA|nr:unnamed protein product [Gongylonema pulchrum]